MQPATTEGEGIGRIMERKLGDIVSEFNRGERII